jgi:hypothetical protein
MSGLPRITALNPIIIAPKGEQTFADYTVVGLNVSEPDSLGDQQLEIDYRPYNYDTKEVYADNSLDSKLVFSLYTEAARSTLVAQTLGAIITVVGLLKQEKELEYAISQLDEGSEKTELESDLEDVQTDLGII